MIPSVEPSLLEQALELPYDDRADLAARLIESLHPPVDEGKDDAYWEKEIARRLEEYDSGAVPGMTWAEARAYIMGKDD
jgi:putative addiction module component (TIGR02574 family)